MIYRGCVPARMGVLRVTSPSVVTGREALDFFTSLETGVVASLSRQPTGSLENNSLVLFPVDFPLEMRSGRPKCI